MKAKKKIPSESADKPDIGSAGSHPVPSLPEKELNQWLKDMTWDHDDWLKHTMNSLLEKPQSHEIVSYVPRTTAVVVLVKPHETEEQAWRRHLKENPQDLRAEVKIFFLPTITMLKPCLLSTTELALSWS